MRRWMRVAIVLAITVGLVATVPAATLAQDEDEEFRISVLFGGPTEAPADTPFFVLHGWGFDPSNTFAIGRSGFSLEIDGVDQGKGKFINFGVHGT